MAYQHHAGYSGQEYDQWVGRNSNNSTLGKVQKQFWFTKSAVLRKFGRKEDENIVASDAELDAKINLFNAIEESTKELRSIIADYQTRICILAQEENSLGKLLKEYGKQDHTKAGKMMVAIGKSLNCIAQHRVGMRSPLVRLYQEVDTFQLRAVEDTHHTVEEMEKVRTEYRGALMWMKKISQDFNPDHYQQLEKFREVQAIVKRKKGRFDQLKVKCLQKIDLLAASRCNMFSHALILYQNNLITFSEKTAKTLKNISSHFKGYEPYKFKVITELTDSLEIGEEKNQGDASAITDSKKVVLETGTDGNESLISFFDQVVDLDSDSGAAAESIQNDFSNVDLLSDHTTTANESDSAQDLLKELFDSPVHSYQPVYSLPIFGCTDLQAGKRVASKIATQTPRTTSQSKPVEQFFLPSQLIDFGFSEPGLTTPESQQNPDLNLPKDGAPTPKNSTQDPLLQAPRNLAGKPILPRGKESSKLDWYKVFQEIDPLTDAGSSLFLKGYDNKQC